MNKIIGKINALILSALMVVSGTAAVTGVLNTNRLTAMAADDTWVDETTFGSLVLGADLALRELKSKGYTIII